MLLKNHQDIEVISMSFLLKNDEVKKDQSKAKIFPAGERGRTEMEWFRSYNTFSFGGYQSEYKKPFGELYVLNDDTLAPGKSFSLTVEEDSAVLLLPIVGAVEYEDEKGNEQLLQAGQSFVCLVPKGKTFTVSNAYENELVNFLQAWFTLEQSNSAAPSLLSFDLNKAQNTLVEITKPQQVFRCLMGKFDGRSEGTLSLSASDNRFFVFIIQGAFEVQNRLLETRDGLALWETDEIEFEALSNEAIVLFIEMPAQERATPLPPFVQKHVKKNERRK